MTTRRTRFAVPALLLAAMASGGCYKPLFNAKTSRTQYEKYDLMRNRYVPMEMPDAFGHPRPALRARLSQDYQ